MIRLRPLLGALLVVSLAACKHHGKADEGVEVDSGYIPDACEGLQCAIVDCAAKGLPPTSISGKVFAPNGTLPLYGVNVYVPASDPGPLPDGAQCDRCAGGLPGGALTQTVTDESGSFTLPNVPATANVPVIIQTGKWRRKLMLPNVAACQDLPIPAADARLPKNKSEGDLPLIAITTGNADSMECLVRKLGIDDAEIGNGGGAQRVHLYHGNGVASFKAGYAGGAGAIGEATPFWSDLNMLKRYDIVFFSCEGGQHAETKPQAALDAVKAYADFGGRVFASHWHNIWVEGATTPAVAGRAPAVWPTIATWSNAGDLPSGSIDLIDEVANPKGVSFATWMLDPLVMGSSVRGEVPILDGTGRTTATSVDPLKAQRWTYVKGGGGTTQNFLFTTPNEVPEDQRCGKVVFSDMHVSGDPGADAYPDSCGSTLTLSPQEKAISFMFFDLASCVGQLF